MVMMMINVNVYIYLCFFAGFCSDNLKQSEKNELYQSEKKWQYELEINVEPGLYYVVVIVTGHGEIWGA